jgi:S-(hydroxymethyl)mycothiol dehydrogenase
MAAIAGSALAGAATIIAVDIDDTELEWARGMGATHTENSREQDPVEVIKGDRGGRRLGGRRRGHRRGSRPETWKQAFYARDLAGTVVLVGVPTPDMRIPDIPLIDVFGRGGALKSSWYGDCLRSRDFPMLVDLYQQGGLDLDAFVTEEVALDDVERRSPEPPAARTAMPTSSPSRSDASYERRCARRTGRLAAEPAPLRRGVLVRGRLSRS